MTLTLCGEPYGSPTGRIVVLRVADSGTGIPPAEREHIFERFHRANGTAAMGERRRAGGSGLGLAICKAIVEAHGGHMRVEDVAGPEESSGACFVVALPAATVAMTPERLSQ